MKNSPLAVLTALARAAPAVISQILSLMHPYLREPGRT
jgi:hypothetical protein